MHLAHLKNLSNSPKQLRGLIASKIYYRFFFGFMGVILSLSLSIYICIYAWIYIQFFRWDVNCIDHLPEFMQHCYIELLNVFEEFEKELGNENKYRFHYAKEAVRIYTLLRTPKF